MAAQPHPRLTPEEYLEFESTANCRHEYYNGRIYAMAGGSHRHAIIIGNLTAELHHALRKSPCIVTPSDFRVAVSEEGLYTYSDVVIACGEPKYTGRRKETLLNPAILIEVLSPSTEAEDRGFKSAQYRTIESLEEYALVSQNEARVEAYRRQDAGHWLLSEFVGLEAIAEFESVGVNIPLAEIYSKVSFEADEPLHPADE